MSLLLYGLQTSFASILSVDLYKSPTRPVRLVLERGLDLPKVIWLIRGNLEFKHNLIFVCNYFSKVTVFGQG